MKDIIKNAGPFKPLDSDRSAFIHILKFITDFGIVFMLDALSNLSLL